MGLKTIKNRNIACLGLGYKLIFKLVRFTHNRSYGMMENVTSGSQSIRLGENDGLKKTRLKAHSPH
jgi:hypothetical protein